MFKEVENPEYTPLLDGEKPSFTEEDMPVQPFDGIETPNDGGGDAWLNSFSKKQKAITILIIVLGAGASGALGAALGRFFGDLIADAEQPTGCKDDSNKPSYCNDTSHDATISNSEWGGMAAGIVFWIAIVICALVALRCRSDRSFKGSYHSLFGNPSANDKKSSNRTTSVNINPENEEERQGSPSFGYSPTESESA